MDIICICDCEFDAYEQPYSNSEFVLDDDGEQEVCRMFNVNCPCCGKRWRVVERFVLREDLTEVWGSI